MDAEKAIAAWDALEAEFEVRGEAYNRDPSTKHIDPFRICGNLYYVGDRIVCAHLLDTGDGLILFDSGYPHAKKLLYASIEALGFRPCDVRHILHSHEHFDHFGATHEMQERFGCRTYIHKEGAEAMRRDSDLTCIYSSCAPDASLFVPDVELSDGDELTFGNTKIRCIYTPGHSAGSATYLFDVHDGERVYRAGICGIGGSFPLHTGRLLKYSIPLTTRDDYLSSIEKLRDCDIEIALDTHPRPNGELDKRQAMLENPDVNPFIDKTAWNAMLDYYRERFFITRQQERI